MFVAEPLKGVGERRCPARALLLASGLFLAHLTSTTKLGLIKTQESRNEIVSPLLRYQHVEKEMWISKTELFNSEFFMSYTVINKTAALT